MSKRLINKIKTCSFGTFDIQKKEYYKKFIELRSDTKTIPTEEMRKSVKKALMGDDFAMEDPTVNALQKKFCELFEVDYALFVPSGTLANAISLHMNSTRGSSILIGDKSHLFLHEKLQLDHHGLKNINLENLPDGKINTDENYLSEVLKDNLINKESGKFEDVRFACLENSHNSSGGHVLTPEDCSHFRKSIKNSLNTIKYTNEVDLKFHLDGSRILNSSVALNIPPKELVKGFFTINVCLSKGLGCPMGSMILLNTTTEKDYAKLRLIRRTFVGSLRQVGFVAAPALVALKDYKERFINDHLNAKIFENTIQNNTEKIFIKKPSSTNIVNLYFHPSKVHIVPRIISECKERGNVLLGGYPGYIRAVFHHQVTAHQAKKAAYTISEIANELL
jgi:threonine aldolase